MRSWAILAVVSLLLAGCSGESSSQSKGGGLEPAIDVKATETTGVIRGVAVDEAIRPLAGVLVNLTTGQSATTGDDGGFGFQGLAPGTYFLQASKKGYIPVQTSTDVVAGVDEPAMVKVLLVADPVQAPFMDAVHYSGFINYGVSIGITSIGSTFLTLVDMPNDSAIWTMQFTQVPTWAQGELVWEQTQPAGGMLIWEMVVGNTNDYKGHRETAESPALAFWNTTVLQGEADNVTDPERGIAYRFFGGPHPLLAPASAGGTTLPPEDQCPWIDTGPVLGRRNPCRFGYGVTAQQRTDGYIHNFYNFAPPEGWRFTVDGDPVIPDSP